MDNPRLLIVDDELNFYGVFRQIFSSYYAFGYTSDAHKGLAMIEQGDWDAVLLDLNFPGQFTYKQGLELLLGKALKNAAGRFPVIVATSDNEADTERIALQMGALGLLRKAEYDPLLWGQRIRECIQLFKEKKHRIPTQKNAARQDPFIAASPVMEDIKARLRKLVNYTHAPVLITGETGVGKEVAARYLHNAKEDATLPFKAVNLRAIHTELIDSEIFEHVKGAFTTAFVNKTGFFEAVGSGTLFLDEIGEINLETQVKLLRVLEERTFQKVGSTADIPLEAHLVFATNRNLELAMEEGDFRQDFYERIKTFSIHLPPLRERKSEILPLICRFFEDLCKPEHPFYGQLVEECFRRPVLEILHEYAWPSNIRELRNVVDHLLFEADFQNKRVIETDLLPLRFTSLPLGTTFYNNTSNAAQMPLESALTEQINWPIDKQTAYNELVRIEHELIRAGGGKDEAARALGLKNDQALRHKVKGKYLKKYPELFNDFPILQKKYKSK